MGVFFDVIADFWCADEGGFLSDECLEDCLSIIDCHTHTARHKDREEDKTLASVGVDGLLSVGVEDEGGYCGKDEYRHQRIN